MPKTKLILVLGLAVLLVATAALTFVAKGVSNTAQNTPSVAMADADLQVPPALPLSSKWQAKPVSGAPVSLPWANIRVNNDATNEAHNEPFVAINPNNPNHMVVGANSWQAGDGHFEVYAYVTFNGGRTWTASQPYINRNASRLNAADPTVAFGSKGEVYFAFVALSPAQGAVAVSRSVDGGLTWSSQRWATSFTTGADKPALIANGGSLHVFYQNGTLMTTVSRDGSLSWGSPAAIEVGGRNAAPVVANGAVHVFYSTAGSIKVARLSDPGNGYSIQTVANVTALQARPTRYRASIYPAAAADSKGNMYVAWADGRNTGRGNDILYSRSISGGWSAPVTVNTDAGSSDQLMPALAVGKDGAVNISWLDNRNDSANYNYDVYMARSANGVNFGANTRVTDISSNPDNDQRTQGTMIGDYFAMAAGDGVVYSFWTDTRNNNEDIYMAPVSTNVND
jgi:hypothetical protein